VEAKILFDEHPTLPTAIDLNKLDTRKDEREEEDKLERMNNQENNLTKI
tara:strand:- start:281 stop:427 length:147 start_codon:yes stop_codon:yes gene_type:complete